MAVQTTMNNSYIKPADAIKKSQDAKKSGAVDFTSRGTAITTANSGMNQNMFLNILVAELTNMDPTQDQDSTAYVTQMAEFATIEQLNNLNTTMVDFANQQKVGQVAILKETDAEGFNKFGIITQIVKSGSSTIATIQDAATGEYIQCDVKEIIGTSDSGASNAGFETALNSNFSSASALASKNSKAVVTETTTTTDEKGKTTTVTEGKKVVIKSAYLDKMNSEVKIVAALLDENGNETSETKTYSYNDIVIAGDLTDELMDEKVKLVSSTVSAPVQDDKKEEEKEDEILAKLIG